MSSETQTLRKFRRRNPTVEAPKHLLVYKAYSKSKQLFGMRAVERAKYAFKFAANNNASAKIIKDKPMKGFSKLTLNQQSYAISLTRRETNVPISSMPSDFKIRKSRLIMKPFSPSQTITSRAHSSDDQLSNIACSLFSQVLAVLSLYLEQQINFRLQRTIPVW